ncbi:NAD(P)/FAD-dependent oxidoreductase [Streptacidiphilus carbonis]|uniref:NAD(P)/FAD-dependent oxidoreductase n=1 Tax=Streptacidiphilus carbonis TaxID=105422 RepID=UPI0005A94F08|nr:NAD(P)/FAD-dependent oxidoreductase [Streptacidiphilus carbonis]
MIDLLVVGGGPAGLATAIHAARAGLDVVVAEPRPAPIDKACGEGLMPGAVHALADLGVTIAGHPVQGIRYLDRRSSAEALFQGGPGRGVRRTELHAALARRARELGVAVLPVRVGVVRQERAAVSAAGITARYLAAADGLHSPIRRQLSLDRRDPRPPRYGLRCHYAVEPWTDCVEVHWSPRAEAYVTPLSPGLVGVAVLTAERGPFEAHLAQFPALVRRLPRTAATAVRGAGPLRQLVHRRAAGRVLLVGDAAGYTDALTGEGVSLALASAAELVRCVRADRPEAYEQAWLRVSRRHRLLTETLLWVRRQPRLAPGIVPAAARLPGVFTALVNQLG